MRPSTSEAYKGPRIAQLRAGGCYLRHSSRSWCASYSGGTTLNHGGAGSKETRRSELLEEHTHEGIKERWQGLGIRKLYIG
jgi:hypothetical protein